MCWYFSVWAGFCPRRINERTYMSGEYCISQPPKFKKDINFGASERSDWLHSVLMHFVVHTDLKFKKSTNAKAIGILVIWFWEDFFKVFNPCPNLEHKFGKCVYCCFLFEKGVKV